MSERIVCSVIVPVYNSGRYLIQCLASVASQSLGRTLFEIIVVDDCSTDPDTLEILKNISEQKKFRDITLTILRHKENQWLAAARNTGVASAKGTYILCLDSDDYIDYQYLKRGCLMLGSHPRAGWIYPAYQKFGNYSDRIFPVEFNAKEFYLNNHCVHACIFRKSDWVNLGGQRAIETEDGLKTFEDWDFLIRLMAQGRYGIPLQEISFHYRQHISSLVTRNWKDQIVSKYLLYRNNIHAYRKLKKAENARISDQKDGHVPRPLSPLPFLDKRIAATIAKIVRADIHPIDFRIFLKSIFRPNRFINDIRGLKFLPSKAAQIAGFISNPTVTADIRVSSKTNKTILFAQTNWDLAGGEVVLLDWYKSTSRLDGYKIISVVENAPIASKARLEEDFTSYAKEWYALNRMSFNPNSKLIILWELILQERPEVLFIMSNSFAYLITPFVKKYLPKTKIVDLLHLEDGEHPGWFEISSEFQIHLDKRIVLSAHWQKTLVQKWGEKQEKTIVIPNTINEELFAKKDFNQEQLKEKWNISESCFVIGFIGRYAIQKNPLVFLNIAASFKSDPKYKFVMMGEGDLADQISNKANALPNVILFNPDKSPAWFYALCDVMIFPSLYEGLPMVGLEAIAMEVPVLAADVVGFKDLEPMGIYLLDSNNFEKESIELLKQNTLRTPSLLKEYLSNDGDKKLEFLRKLIETVKD